MEKNNIKKQNAYLSEEEKTLNGKKFKIYLKKISEAKFILVGYKKFH